MSGGFLYHTWPHHTNLGQVRSESAQKFENNYENEGNVHFYSDEGDVRFEEADDPSMSSDNLTSYLMSVNSAFN